MHLFPPRHSPNKFGSALGLSKTFIPMHLFSPRHSSNKFGSALGLSKTLIISYPLVRLFLCRNTVPEEVGASSRSVVLFRTADTCRSPAIELPENGIKEAFIQTGYWMLID